MSDEPEFLLVRASVSMAGIDAGSVVLVDREDAHMKLLLAAGYLVPEPAAGGET